LGIVITIIIINVLLSVCLNGASWMHIAGFRHFYPRQ
jgi:hypothetical protein